MMKLKKKDVEFINDIQEVSLEHNFRHTATKDLLRVLRKYTSTPFSKDPRTLLGTPTKTPTLKIEGGEYYHFGIKFALIKLINDLQLDKVVYGSVQQKRATERARCLFRVKGALFNSLIIVCCFFEKKPRTYIDRFFTALSNGAIVFIAKRFLPDENSS